ncbi:iron-containing alcohol dehydrogenase [Polycladomyces sp. WAk]|uniref:Iron-containing alcohol dehydrogenase n=1 Tax=Polycladomyces zharkentensis TaxID=2807616 RepID=A0ABS2WK54_9BACL|nr:iron-containing alcohol dehydrogenase [Polycladomyces sp. WAk]MBN2909916.1 iron-containing alcohol dehydrogenase [Polycladomyces sp. WAk]
MENFVFHNPTKLIFGKGQLSALRTELADYGQNVLLVYGGGSIKRNGIYDRVMAILREMGKNVYELPGVEPNPRLSTVNKGIEICKRENIDFLLAVGGGSVIDCTKAIAIGARYDGDVWDIIMRRVNATSALPLGTVLTHAATGSEMNNISVITNWETKDKVGWSSPHVYPKFSILDPTHTFTVPKEQTVYGIVDMMSHVLEQYFSKSPNTPVLERFCESILRTIVETAPKLMEDLTNYEYRETIMYCGTLALNGLLAMGMAGDWGTHRIEHAVSAVYDIPHGGGLAILFPNWMKYALDEDEDVSRFTQLAIRVFDVDPAGKSDREVALEGIERLRAFWDSLGAPSRLADYGIDDSKLELMAEKSMIKGEFGRFKRMTKTDVLEVLRMSL